MGRTGYPRRRKTYAPATAGALGLMLAIVIGAAADSKALFFIAWIACTLLVYIICSKIEDAIYHAADKTREVIENKISGASEESSIPSSKEVEVPQKTKANPGTNEWKCVCGKINQNYTGQCVCGVRKNDAAKRIEENKAKVIAIAKKKNLQLPKEEEVSKDELLTVSKQFEKENEWRCVCGKTNPKFVGTCQCGMRKNEAIKRRAIALQKSREIIEAKKAKAQGVNLQQDEPETKN